MKIALLVACMLSFLGLHGYTCISIKLSYIAPEAIVCPHEGLYIPLDGVFRKFAAFGACTLFHGTVS